MISNSGDVINKSPFTLRKEENSGTVTEKSERAAACAGCILFFCNHFLSSKWKRGYIPIIIRVISEIVIKAMERKCGFLKAVQCATYIEGERRGEESGVYVCVVPLYIYIYIQCMYIVGVIQLQSVLMY